MITYGSYLDDKVDTVNSTIIIVFANSSFDLIVGVLVFSTPGYLVSNKGVEFTSFGTGAGAAFIAGLLSSISMLESFATVH
ncbi:hypothetical protein [Clostridium sp.]|uniref:hypothetical protein n=1 Tax=Clostridium sp. TaxID=1506 RepID=UPI002FCB239B